MIKQNLISVIGRLTADPELRQTDKGDTLCNFTVAVPRPRTTDKTDFIRCTAWNQPSKYLCTYGKKGDKVCVEGNLQSENYTDKDGNKREKAYINVQTISLETAKADGENEVQTKPAPKSERDDVPAEDLPF